MDALDQVVVDHLADLLLRPERLQSILNSLTEHQTGLKGDVKARIAEINARGAHAEAKLLRLYQAIENGVVDRDDPSLAARISELKTVLDKAKSDAERIASDRENGAPTITSASLQSFSTASRLSMKTKGGGFQRQYVRKFARPFSAEVCAVLRSENGLTY